MSRALKVNSMGRSLSPILRQELANLDKDTDSRRSAMKALKSYVKDLDTKAIPLFLAQVSRTKETGLSGECTISLYEVLARVHGVKIVPMIDSIMVTIVKTLSSSAGSFPLQQACSKVVPAIARYGIDLTTPEDKKRLIIRSLCDPLSDSLLGSRESLSSGAALCLKALVDSENWRFASDDLVDKLCQVAAGALEEKLTQTISHMGLVTALAKRNASLVEPYAGRLIRAGLMILDSGLVEGNSQKRLSAIQMVNFLMRWLDPWRVFSELPVIVKEMEKFQSDDQMAYVRGAAFEALQTAKRIEAEKGSKFIKSPVSVTGSNFSWRDRSNRGSSSPRELSPSSVSPESQTFDSFDDYELWSESPISTMNSSSRVSGYDRRIVNRKLWSFENGGVDVSLKDGLFSQVAMESTGEFDTISSGDREEEFAGFVQKNPRFGMSRSTTTSPLRSRGGSINVENIIFNTPRKLVHSLQDPDNSTSKQTRRIRSLSLTDFDWSPPSRCDQNYSSSDNEKLRPKSPKSVLSSDKMADNIERQVSFKGVQELGTEKEIQTLEIGLEKGRSKINFKLVFGLFFLLVAVILLFVWMSDFNEFDSDYLVPT